MKSTPTRRLTLSAAVAALCCAVAAPGQQRFSDLTSVVVVEVPVQVLEDGRPVRGLTAADFEIRDGREKRRIVAFDAVDLTGETQIEPTELPVAARRHFLFLFDLSFSEPDSVARAREAARELLRHGLHPTDLVGVATYAASKGVTLVLGFTPDREQVDLAIETLGLAQPLTPVVDPLGLMIARLGENLQDVRRDAAALQGGPARSSAVGPRAALAAQESYLALRDLQSLGERASRDRQQEQILDLTGSLEETARMLASVEGRVHLVLLSEGFDTAVALGIQGETGEERRRIGEINDASLSGELWRVDSESRFGSGTTLSGLQETIDTFRRAGVSIQAVDVGGLRAGPGIGRAAGEDGLFLLANETGGELYRNFNDLGAAMERMLERTSVSYLLAFQAEGLTPDGRYHELEVKVKGLSRKVRVVHRPGYYAPKPLALQTAVERQLTTASRLMGRGQSGQFVTSVLATPTVALSGGEMYVPVVVEADGPGILAAVREPALELELYAYAIDTEGRVRDFLAHSLSIDPVANGDRLRQGGVRLYGGLTLPPGKYDLRVLVRESLSGASSVTVLPLAVPALSGPEPVALAPLFPGASEQWVTAHLSTVAEERGRAPKQPFTWGDQPFLPSALPFLGSLREVQVCLRVYHVGAGDEVGLAFRRPEDGVTAGAGFSIDRGFSLVGSDGRCVPAWLTVPAVPAGHYDLVFTVRGASGVERSAATPVYVGSG